MADALAMPPQADMNLMDIPKAFTRSLDMSVTVDSARVRVTRSFDDAELIEKIVCPLVHQQRPTLNEVVFHHTELNVPDTPRLAKDRPPAVDATRGVLPVVARKTLHGSRQKQSSYRATTV
jgi:hypothetical protein